MNVYKIEAVNEEGEREDFYTHSENLHRAEKDAEVEADSKSLTVVTVTFVRSI